ncbi:MAG: ferrochelatase [Marinicaulis sp.]|nr:ferrochelatase [Marinicaulis sp.]
MSQNHRPNDHPLARHGRIGALLVNLGTPDAPTSSAVRRYLREFLADKRVVDLPRFIWLPILHGIILNVRPPSTAKKYKKIWFDVANESPLRHYTRKQASTVADLYEDQIIIEWAMRYGNPSIAKTVSKLASSGCDKILIVPLYPQYSATTTASVGDAVFDALRNRRWQPAIRMAPPFYDEALYIAALRDVTTRHLESLSWAPERVVISFHGIPQRYFDAGDPYFCHCSKTARLLREAMQWSDDFAPMAFQSKFGREKWLEPSTEQTIKIASENGIKNIAVITPAFVSDCIETLEEIDIELRSIFESNGGEKFTLIPCLNDSPEMISLLQNLIERETSGWR